MKLVRIQKEEVTAHMNKNAYEIRLDILAIAHQYETLLFSERMAMVKNNKEPALDDIQKIYPSRENILKTAELFYSFVSENGRGSR
jgi:hypothetical protein